MDLSMTDCHYADHVKDKNHGASWQEEFCSAAWLPAYERQRRVFEVKRARGLGGRSPQEETFLLYMKPSSFYAVDPSTNQFLVNVLPSVYNIGSWNDGSTILKDGRSPVPGRVVTAATKPWSIGWYHLVFWLNSVVSPCFFSWQNRFTLEMTRRQQDMRKIQFCLVKLGINALPLAPHIFGDYISIVEAPLETTRYLAALYLLIDIITFRFLFLEDLVARKGQAAIWKGPPWSFPNAGLYVLGSVVGFFVGIILFGAPMFE